MELAGEEKKLQALFSELKAADKLAAPRFATISNRAQLAPRRVSPFKFAFVSVTALLFFAVVSLAVWSKYSRPAPRGIVEVKQPMPLTPVPVAPTASITTGNVEVGKPAPPRIIRKTRTAKLSAQQLASIAANQKLKRDAKSIADWQSPTSALLSSSSEELFNSLPQLNQNASELKSFLPARSNEK